MIKINYANAKNTHKGRLNCIIEGNGSFQKGHLDRTQIISTVVKSCFLMLIVLEISLIKRLCVDAVLQRITYSYVIWLRISHLLEKHVDYCLRINY